MLGVLFVLCCLQHVPREVNALAGTTFMPALECYDPYGRPQVGEIKYKYIFDLKFFQISSEMHARICECCLPGRY